MENFLKASQGQSHRTRHRHSFHLSATGNEPEAKGLPAEGEMFLELLTMDDPSKKRTLEVFNYFSNPIARGIGILSIFPPLEMSRRLKGFLPKNGCLYKLGTPGRGDIFVEFGCLKWPTHSVGEIFFWKSLLNSFPILNNSWRICTVPHPPPMSCCTEGAGTVRQYTLICIVPRPFRCQGDSVGLTFG